MVDANVAPDGEKVGTTGGDEIIAPGKYSSEQRAVAEIAEILYALKLGLRANLRWLEKSDVGSAIETSGKMCDYVESLETLLRERFPSMPSGKDIKA